MGAARGAATSGSRGLTQRLEKKAEAALKRREEEAGLGRRAARFAARVKDHLYARRYSYPLLCLVLLIFVLKRKPTLWKKLVQLLI